MPRTRLVRRLCEAPGVPVALLAAPAGYGKTTVLSQWAEIDARPVAWVRVDAGHSESGRLVAAIAGALGVKRSTKRIRDLTDEIAARRRPFVLVLDDAHEIREQRDSVLDAIAAAMPPGSQLALASRGEPSLAVGRLRAHRKILELRTDELAMDRSEAAELLDGTGLEVHRQELDVLMRRTQGWPAALYLAALALRGEPDLRAAVSGFGGDDRIVAEYLHDEMLAPLEPEQISFLVRSSVVETLSGALCDAVLETAGSGRVLADLARFNPLLASLDRHGESYRHHALFAEMLRAELRRREPALEPELHRRASVWHRTRGESLPAIRHALTAGDVDLAAEILWAHCGGDIGQEAGASVRRLLAEFTADQIAARPQLALVAAGSSLAAGDRAQAERWTADAARHLDLGESSSGCIQVALSVLRAAVGKDGLSRMSSEAMAAVGSEPDLRAWRSAGSVLAGMADHLTGRREQARVALKEATRGGAVAAPNIRALGLAQLALLAIEGEDWDDAAVLTARVRSHIQASGLEHLPAFALAFAVSGLVRAHRGLVEAARGDLQRARRMLTRTVDFAPWYLAETQIVLARATMRLGDVKAARALLAEATQAIRETPDATTLRDWLDETRADLEIVRHAAGETCALTPAELRVLRLLPTHLSFPAIASRLYVSPNTVKTHVRAVYRKLDASSRAEAVAHALAAGLLDERQA